LLYVGDIFTDDPRVRDISADITLAWIIGKNISNKNDYRIMMIEIYMYEFVAFSRDQTQSVRLRANV
jgi:hypothetical protein